MKRWEIEISSNHQEELRKDIALDPYAMFLYALDSPVTRERYSTRLRYFFSKIGLAGQPMEELCRAFVEKGRQNPNWIVKSMIIFLTEYRDRYDRREISGATIRNYVKPVKLMCEMSDLEIPWKRITRGLPRGKKAADDRAPSIEEIRKLCEYPDRRIKAIIYTMCSSGIRLGAWDYLRWGHMSTVEKDGQLLAARLTVYAGEEDQYYAFYRWVGTRI